MGFSGCCILGFYLSKQHQVQWRTRVPVDGKYYSLLASVYNAALFGVGFTVTPEGPWPTSWFKRWCLEAEKKYAFPKHQLLILYVGVLLFTPFLFAFAGHWSDYELCSERAAGAGAAEQREAHAGRRAWHAGAFENVPGGGAHVRTLQPPAHPAPQGRRARVPAQRQHRRRHPLHLPAREIGQNGHAGETSGHAAQTDGFPQNERHEPRRRLLRGSAASGQVLYCLINSMLLRGCNSVVSDSVKDVKNSYLSPLLNFWRSVVNCCSLLGTLPAQWHLRPTYPRR